MTHTSRACKPCRKNRTKCNGVDPCSSCESRKRDCVFESVESDGRSKEARKRKVDELSDDRALLEELLSAIHRSEDQDIANIISLIRSIPLAEEMKPAIKRQLLVNAQVQREQRLTPRHLSGKPDTLEAASEVQSEGASDKAQLSDKSSSASSQHEARPDIFQHREKYTGSGSATLDNLCDDGKSVDMRHATREHQSSDAIDLTFSKDEDLVNHSGLYHIPQPTLSHHEDPSSKHLPQSSQDLESKSNSHLPETEPEDATEDPHIAPGAARSFGNLSMSDAVVTNRYSPDVQARQLRVIHGPIEICLPIHCNRTTAGMAEVAADAVSSFCEAARKEIAQGVPARTVLSMDGFDLDLFHRDRMPDDLHTVASWASEWGKAWKLFPIEVRYAAIHYCGTLMRWLIMPCKETYQMMSPLVRPLPCQLMIPHTVDVDLWGAPPVMRELQLLNGGRWLNDVTPNTQRLAWPNGPESCTEKMFVSCSAAAPGAIDDGQGGYVRRTERLSPEFIAFIDKKENWTIHRNLLAELPELRGRTQFHE